MATLHEALASLSPVDWSEVPSDEPDAYISNAFAAAELICNSVPQPPGGSPFHESTPNHTQPNIAKSAKEIHPSATRQFHPHKDHHDLHKLWGKPMKFNARDNPLDVALYKMASHDRRGAWFARRSVHEGLGFAKWKKALQQEFPHSLAVEGGPGAGAVRGLAADRRLELVSPEGPHRLEVYQLSAQFPGPTTPRDFVPLILSSDDALSEKSAVTFKAPQTHVPRHYILVSRPCKHPETLEHSGYVRGQYESVEMIREIPLHHHGRRKSNPNPVSHDGDQITRQRGATIAFSESRGSDAKGEKRDLNNSLFDMDGAENPELNPVEWIMITRSDPGGGLPRFLVERGTPDAMLADVSKFFDWACNIDEATDSDEDRHKQLQTGEHVVEPHTTTNELESFGTRDQVPPTLKRAATMPGTQQESSNQSGGFLSSLTTSIHAGFEAVAPAVVSDHVNHYLRSSTPHADSHDSSSSSDTSSINSFLSAEDLRRLSMVDETRQDAASYSQASDLKSENSESQPRSIHEVELQKLASAREKLDRDLIKKREEEEEKHRKHSAKSQNEQEKARERLERELKKTDERHQKALEKLRKKEAKHVQKMDDKRRKQENQHKLNMVVRERDEFRTQADLVKRQNSLLTLQVERLQRENTLLTQKLGKVAGDEALKSVREELGKTGRHSRAASVRSSDSTRSVKSSNVLPPS